QPVIISVLANDSDAADGLDPSTVRVVSAPNPSGTTEVLPDGTIRYTPAADFVGDATFTYRVDDNMGNPSPTASVLVRVQNSRWQNPYGSLDVNGDGFVSPIDALQLINYLNSNAERHLPSTGRVPPPYLDPNGDE